MAARKKTSARKRGLGRVTVKIEEIETGGKSFKLVARTRFGEAVGYLSAHPTKIGGRKVFAVDNIDVDESVRRQGVATQLYEAAASLACTKRGRLASRDRLPWAYSNEFWEKQAAKGRAEVFKAPRGGVKDRGSIRYVLTTCGESLAGVRRKLR